MPPSLCLLDHFWAPGSLGARDRDCEGPASATCVSTVCVSQGQSHLALSPSLSHQVLAATLAVWWRHQPHFTGEETEARQVPHSGHRAGNKSGFLPAILDYKSSAPSPSPSCFSRSNKSKNLSPSSYFPLMDSVILLCPVYPCHCGSWVSEGSEGFPGQGVIRADSGLWVPAHTAARLGLPLPVYKFHYSSSDYVSLPRR